MAHAIQPRPAARALLPAGVVLFCLLGAAILLFAFHGLSALRFPYPVDYGEGPLLDQVVRLSRWENIYPPDLSQAPYTISNYPPLFLLLQVGPARMFGPAYWYGRASSIFSIAAVSLFIGLSLHRLTADRLAALCGGLMLPVIPYVLRWSPLFRVDAAALALSWAALFVLVRFSGRRWCMPCAVLLFVAAVFTRQSYLLAAPLAGAVLVWRQHSLRRAFFQLLLFAAICAAVFASLQIMTGGGFFLHVVKANVNEFRLERVRAFALEVCRYMPCLLAISGAFVLFARGRAGRLWWFAGTYLAGGFLAALTIGKVGSNVNYLFELSAAFCLVAGASIALSRNHPRLRLCLMILLMLQVLLALRLSQANYFNRVMYKVSQKEDMDELMKAVGSVDGPVLTDEHMGLLPLAGKRIILQPFEFTQLARLGRWDEEPFVETLNRCDFDLVLLWNPGLSTPGPNERWTRPMLEAIRTHYVAVGERADTVILRPRR